MYVLASTIAPHRRSDWSFPINRLFIMYSKDINTLADLPGRSLMGPEQESCEHCLLFSPFDQPSVHIQMRRVLRYVGSIGCSGCNLARYRVSRCLFSFHSFVCCIASDQTYAYAIYRQQIVFTQLNELGACAFYLSFRAWIMSLLNSSFYISPVDLVRNRFFRLIELISA